MKCLLKFKSFLIVVLVAAFFNSLSVFAEQSGDEPSDIVYSQCVTIDRVNFRKGPSLDSGVNKILHEETAIMAALDGNEWSVAICDGVVGYIKSEYVMTKEDYAKLPKNRLELLSWNEARNSMRIGTDAKIFDVRTGLTYYIRSFSNGNHADVEPVTKEDTAIMKKTFGGVWKWDPRPVWVTINGRTIAASINGMPHGGGVNGNNGMDGQVCLHFKGSTTHNGNKAFAADHQDAVMEAWYSK